MAVIGAKGYTLGRLLVWADWRRYFSHPREVVGRIRERSVYPRPMRARRLSRLLLRSLAIGWLVFWFIWLLSVRSTFVETDSQAYWGFDMGTLYTGVHLGDQGAFLYSPLVAQLLAPFSALPYGVFYALLAAANLGALVYLLGWELAALSLFLVPVSNEIARGNIHLLLALAIVIGMRRPAAWAAVLLTKVTPGIGLLWFAVRREWGALAIAIGTTAVLTAVSFVFVPDLWRAWVTMLLSNSGATRPNAVLQVPVLPRLAVAAVLLAVGAWWNKPAIVPVAALLALPAIWVNSLSMLVAIIPLWRAGPIPRESGSNALRSAIGHEPAA
jgi:hypothetical protein